MGDIPPLAFAAAAAAGVPAIALCNFTWDWIYGAYPLQLAAAPSGADRGVGATSAAGERTVRQTL